MTRSPAFRRCYLAGHFAAAVVCLLLLLISGLLAAQAQVSDRMREPVVISATTETFPRWVDASVPAASLELWTYRNYAWSIVPFQVDEVTDEPKDVKGFILNDSPQRQCIAMADPGIDPEEDGPCEYLYALRGTAAPSGEFTTNDELVFLAGAAASCSAPTSSWPDSGLELYRYRIEVKDTQPGGDEAGCVYLFRRTSGSAPTVPDLISYDPSGDGVPVVCRPTSDACGAIVAPAADVDGDQLTDTPAYQLDFYGNWTIDKWMIGETCSTACPAQDMVDIVKWRIDNPAETERVWDLHDPLLGYCAYFGGYIDGPVRVIRVIQGAMSGGTTRKLEYAYPGEVMHRVYLRVHKVGGPIYRYPDLLEANVSPNSESLARVYKDGYTGSEEFDEIDGSQAEHPTFDLGEWYQVSSPIGSFLSLPGTNKYSGVGVTDGSYDDSDTSLWKSTRTAEWDSEVGDKGVATPKLSDLVDTQNVKFCVDPHTDDLTAIEEFTWIMLSEESASSGAGHAVVQDRARGVLSQCIEEEEYTVPKPGPGSSCAVSLLLSYGDDGGPVTLGSDLGGCSSVLGWNLYQIVGPGVYKRIATLQPSKTFSDVTLALNEERSYVGSPLVGGCVEGNMSTPVTVLHQDLVAPPPPEDVTAEAGPSSITVSWSPPLVGDLAGFKVLVGTVSGGPYDQVHQGILDPLTTEHTFPAASGPTYYSVMKAVDHAGNESVPSEETIVALP